MDERTQPASGDLAGADAVAGVLQGKGPETGRKKLNQQDATAAGLCVSIVNWNTREALLGCLRSIFDSDVGGLHVQVVVVDNASSDGSAEAARREFPQVTVLAQDKNLGFASSNNRAFGLAKDSDVFVLNPDTEVLPTTLRALMDFRARTPAAGIIGPRVLNPDGSIQHSARSFPTLAAGIFRHSFLGRLFPGNRYTRGYLQSDWDHSDARQVDWVSGCAMLITREALLDLRGFDEDYFMYVEDVDICWRARQMGWEVWFCPDAQITHEKAKASDLAQGRMIWQHHRSMYTFYRKHYRERSGMLQRIITPAGIFTRAAIFVTMNRIRRWLRPVR